MTRSLSIIIPAYNEESRLPETLLRISNFLASTGWRFAEILVVDDGSQDRTVQVAESYAQNGCPVRVLRNPGNRGKGYSVRHGMLEARADWLLFSDADLSTPIEELEKLWLAVSHDTADIAIGSRALDRSLIGVRQPLFREKAGQVFNWVMRQLLGLAIHDTQCGFKLFRAATARRIFSRQQLERFSFDAEILFIARKLGYRIVEIPVRWDNVEGSKVGMWNGAQSFLDLARVRLNAIRGIYKLED